VFTLRQYLLALLDSRGLTRTLGEIDVCRDEQGRPCFSAGNSAAVFRIRLGGRIRSLRCYLRPMRHLKEIYGQRLLEKELYLHTSPETGVWVDTVLGDWIEGSTLHETVAQAAALRDRESLQILVRLFDRLALALVTDDRAHGDLKPENIIVGDDGTLCPIDFDASYLPAFAGEISPELGTAAYQHPARTAADFDERIDDYPAALISTALHALAEDPTLWDRYGSSDGLLYTPQRIASDPAYRETLALFEKRGMAVQYRIAQLLTAPTLRLFGLAELLAEAVREKPAARSGTEAETPELFVENGRWGYRTAERVVVAPLYDNGFDFTEGLCRRSARRHVALHRHGGPHAPELPGLCGGEAVPRRKGAGRAQRRTAGDRTSAENAPIPVRQGSGKSGIKNRFRAKSAPAGMPLRPAQTRPGTVPAGRKDEFPKRVHAI